MENSRGMINLGDFNEGGPEPDRLYPTQASNSEIDLSSLGVALSNEPENSGRNMARQGMIREAQDQSRSGIFEEGILVDLNMKMRRNEDFRKFDRGDDDIQDIHQTLVRFDRGDAVNQVNSQTTVRFDRGDDDIQDINQTTVRLDRGDAVIQDIHQTLVRFDRIHDDIQGIRQNLARFDRGDAVQDIHQTTVRAFYSASLSVLEDMHQILKKQIENLVRQNTTSYGIQVFEGISSPIPASIPRNKTKACPEAITDPQEQKNEPNNQEPGPGVNTSKKRRYGKFKGIQPLEIEEVPVDSHSGPSVPLLIGIPATDVLSVGRGSHAEEASQKGRVRRKCDQCCCSIM